MATPKTGYCVDATCPCHTKKLKTTCCTRCRRNGLKPLTIVEPAVAISVEAMANRIKDTQTTHDRVLGEYHKIWYESGHTWAYTHFLGLGMMKCPNDLWTYQDIMMRLRPTTVIETGTYTGASALWFAYLMDMLCITDGQVVSIDIDNHKDKKRWASPHPRITFLRGSSTDPKIAAKALRHILPGPTLISLDSDHSEAHVRKELELYAPSTKVGDWVVVEDTNVGWAGPNGTGDRGARGGVEDYLRAHPGEFGQDILSERYLLTMNPGGWMFRTAPHVPTSSLPAKHHAP